MRSVQIFACLAIAALGIVVFQVVGPVVDWGSGAGGSSEERLLGPSLSASEASSAGADAAPVALAPVVVGDLRDDALVVDSRAAEPVALDEVEFIEEMAPAIDGPSISGVLLDRDGQPHGSGELILHWTNAQRSDTARGDRYEFECQSDGSFAVGLRRAGTAEVWAEAEGVGRSLGLRVLVPANAEAAVGELRLVGPGRMEGRLQLPDGTPLGDVSFGVTALDREALGGCLSAFQQLGEDGRFELTGLAPGQYEFYANSPAPIEILSPKIVAAGAEDCIVEANAVLLTIRCTRDGEVASMKAYHRRTLEAPDRASGGSRRRNTGNGQSFGMPVAETTVLFSASERFALRGIDAEGRTYYGLVEPGLPPGRHEIDLLPTHPEFSIARFRLEVPVEGSRLMVKKARGDSGWATVIFRSDPNLMGTRPWQEVACLNEGAFAFALALSGDGEQTLAEPSVQVTLQRGRAVERVVRSVVGGRMELRVDGDPLETVASDAGTARPSAAMSYLRSGPEADWEPVLYEFPGLMSGSFSRSLNLGEDGLLSAPMRPATYQLRLKCKGYHTHEQDVTVEPGSTTTYAVRLERKE